MALGITRAQAAVIAHWKAIPDGNEDMVTVPEVESMIDTAAAVTCDLAAEDPKNWQRLQDTDFNVAVTNGEGTLSVSIIPSSLKSLEGGRVIFTRTDPEKPQFLNPLKYCDDIAAIYRKRRGGEEIGYFSVRGGNATGGKIYVHSGRGEPANGSAKVLAKKYYTFETLPSELKDEFIRVLADMVRARMNKVMEIMGNVGNPEA